MSELFKLIDKNFSKEDNEWQWTYVCLFEFIFNEREIKQITITDHTWKKKGREKITKGLILHILKKELNNHKAKPTNYQGKRKVFVRERIYFEEKRYWLNFWFKDGTDNHLWIRNCHQQD